jgi:hypothetical protein
MKTETKTAHTPTPWKVIKGDREHAFNIVHDSKNGGTAVVRDVLKEANAVFIVRAVNSHDNLINAIKLLLECVDASQLPEGALKAIAEVLDLAEDK